ncbi:hypothetical protein BVAVS116_H0122 (plasmid) [Borreliella valaisiana VS116]|uniref:Uncharacterized protein n=1 Tax=Borreliella valaisiana VS116 TaxID=445987 RepID=C0R937_BORVA|nr:hypothetical protein BVAVS116_H0122 [Borreliella valaisiana VS116]
MIYFRLIFIYLNHNIGIILCRGIMFLVFSKLHFESQYTCLLELEILIIVLS